MFGKFSTTFISAQKFCPSLPHGDYIKKIKVVKNLSNIHRSTQFFCADFKYVICFCRKPDCSDQNCSRKLQFLAVMNIMYFSEVSYPQIKVNAIVPFCRASAGLSNDLYFKLDSN